MAPAEIARRAREIRLQNADLARLTRLVPDTVSRTLRGRTDPRYATHARLSEALLAEEKRLLAHLIALHPAAAMAALCPERVA